MANNIQNDEYWTYVPKVIPSFVFEPLLIMMKEYCVTASSSTRVSCVFNGINNRIFDFSYGRMAIYKWNDAPIILHEICETVKLYTQTEYDYVLVHIYSSGDSSIAYHSDHEAMGTTIASVSLGATRKFRLRKIGRTKGWDHEILLNDGDLIIMHGPVGEKPSCQKIYQHSVPVEKKVKGPRINLTFRQYDTLLE